jgi:hypothetical protein
MTDTPTYDQLMAERTAAGEWTPDQLRPGLNLDTWLADSYMRVMTRSHLLRQIEKRAKVRSRKRQRRHPLP